MLQLPSPFPVLTVHHVTRQCCNLARFVGVNQLPASSCRLLTGRQTDGLHSARFSLAHQSINDFHFPSTQHSQQHLYGSLVQYVLPGRLYAIAAVPQLQQPGAKENASGCGLSPCVLRQSQDRRPFPPPLHYIHTYTSCVEVVFRDLRLTVKILILMCCIGDRQSIKGHKPTTTELISRSDHPTSLRLHNHTDRFT